jgi:hypothetical protein
VRPIFIWRTQTSDACNTIFVPLRVPDDELLAGEAADFVKFAVLFVKIAHTQRLCQ